MRTDAPHRRPRQSPRTRARVDRRAGPTTPIGDRRGETEPSESGLYDVRTLRSLLKTLDALAELKEAATVRALVEKTSLSRASVDRSLRILVDRGLARRQDRRFGRPTAISLTKPGKDAAGHAHSLLLLFSGGPIGTAGG